MMDFERQSEIESSQSWKESSYLQDKVKPVHYDLFLRPMLDYNRFQGRVKINVEVLDKTSYFAVHSKELTIKSCGVTYVGEDSVAVPVKKSFDYPEHEFYILQMEKLLKPGFYNLDFEFEGPLKTGSVGFFKRNCSNQNKKKSRTMAATKFKYMEARKVYPCFDEAHLKATFSIKLVRPAENYIAITNEEVKSEEFGPDKNEITVCFKETKPISTYVTGFIVADLEECHKMTIDNMGSDLNFKILTASAVADEMKFAKEITDKSIKFFIKYFQIPFPVSRIDYVAIPDFQDVVVQQYGFTTFDEKYLIFDENFYSLESKQIVSHTVTGEICRQWFGCMVTMKRWHDFWLCDSFITMMKYRSLCDGGNLYDDIKMAEHHFLLDVIQLGLVSDAAIKAVPLQNNFENPDEFNTFVSNEAVFKKGAGLLRMLEVFIGKDGFQSAVHRFLNTYSHSSVSIDDFWNCFNSEVNDPDVNISAFMGNWANQIGYPVIYVVKRANTWIICQSRFVEDRNAFLNSTQSTIKYKWDIPLYYVTSNDSNPTLIWFKSSDECLKLVPTRMVSYIKFNANQAGFYRVNYEACLWKLFARLLIQNHKTFNSVDRANFIDDVFHLAEAGQTEFQHAFGMIEYLDKERGFLPWMTVTRNIKSLLQRYPNSAYYSLTINYMRPFVMNMYGCDRGQFNWDSSAMDNFTTRLFRREIVEFACICKLPECLSDLSTKFQAWITTGKKPVSSYMMGSLLRYGMLEVGTVMDWEVVWERYLKETNNEMKDILLICLASTREPCLVMRMLTILNTKIPDDVYLKFLEHLSENITCNYLLWNFIRNDYTTLMERLFSYRSRLIDLIVQLTSRFYLRHQIEEVELFFNNHPEIAEKNNARETVMDRVNQNFSFIERNINIISGWLIENMGIIG